MRYSLRTLLILMLVLGPLCACGWIKYSAYLEVKAREAASIANSKKLALRQAQIAKVPRTPIAGPLGKLTQGERRQLLTEAYEACKLEGIEDEPYTYSTVRPDGERISIAVTIVTKYSPSEWALQQSQTGD